MIFFVRSDFMPVKPDSRFAKLPALQTVAPDGTIRRVISLRLDPSLPEGGLTRHTVRQDEDLDTLASKLLRKRKPLVADTGCQRDLVSARYSVRRRTEYSRTRFCDPHDARKEVLR